VPYYTDLKYALDAKVQTGYTDWKDADAALRAIRATTGALVVANAGATVQEVSDLDDALHALQVLFNVLQPEAAVAP